MSYKPNHKYITDLKDLPADEHYAVLVENSFSYEDGYGERGSSSYSTHKELQYISFDGVEALTAWLLQNDDGRTKYRVISAKPARVVKQVTIKVE